MEASEEEWVNSKSYLGEGRTICNYSIASMAFFVRKIHLISYLQRGKTILQILDLLYHTLESC